MNDNIDKVQAIIERLYDEDQLQKLQQKYRKRTEAETLKPFAIILSSLGYCLQIISALLAAGGVFLLVQKFTSAAFVFVPVAVFLLVCLEILKRTSYEAFNKQRVSGAKIGKTIVFMMIGFASFSVLSSYFGTEHTIRTFAAVPAQIDTDSILKVYESQKAESSDYWNTLGRQAALKADEIHSANSWKGRTTRSARSSVLAFETKAKAMNDSLINQLSLLDTQKEAEIQKAKTNNEFALVKHDRWCSSFGFSVACLSIVFEFVFFLICLFLSNYDSLRLKTQIALQEVLQEESQERKRSEEVPSIKEPKEKNQDKVQGIGFSLASKNKEGDILEGNGSKSNRILVKKKDGSFKAYTEGALRNYYNGSSDSRKEELFPLLKKIENVNS